MQASLYAQLLGDAWQDLNEEVRMLHSTSECDLVQGTFDVRRGRNPLLRAIQPLVPLPRGGEAVPLILTIVPRGESEVWRRIFDGRCLGSVISQMTGFLVECFGPMEVRYYLRVVDGSLLYEQISTALRAGPLRVCLPRFFSPAIRAQEHADGGQVTVDVQVTHPLLGLLVSYRGRVRVTREAS
jgi:hypothetical protein